MDFQPRHFGLRLKELRKLRRLTQEGLAKQMGVEQATIARWESGVHSPSEEVVRKLAKLLGDELFKIWLGERSDYTVSQIVKPSTMDALVSVLTEKTEQLQKAQSDFASLQQEHLRLNHQFLDLQVTHQELLGKVAKIPPEIVQAAPGVSAVKWKGVLAFLGLGKKTNDTPTKQKKAEND